MPHLHTNYLEKILNVGQLQRTLDAAVRELTAIDFDTIAVTGVSGCVFGGALSARLGKNLVVVRKQTEDCHAGKMYFAEGTFGARWVFVDDTIHSGATLRRVREAIRKYFAEVNYEGAVSFVEVGAYEYNKTEFNTPEQLGWAS